MLIHPKKTVKAFNQAIREMAVKLSSFAEEMRRAFSKLSDALHFELSPILKGIINEFIVRINIYSLVSKAMH